MDEWKPKFIKAEPHRVLARRSKYGIPLHVTYEYIRLALKGQLMQELLACTIEEELESGNADEAKSAPEPMDSSSDRGYEQKR